MPWFLSLSILRRSLGLFIFLGLLLSISCSMSPIFATIEGWENDAHIGDSCTIFTTTIGNTVFFGNNEDYRLWGIYAWIMPSQDIQTPTGSRNVHGAIFFGFDDNGDPADGYPQGGINDQGLCMDGNALSQYTLIPHSERDPPYAALLAQVLWECATVEDVVEWFGNHTIGSSMPYQLHYADATGDAVVVSAGPDHELAFTRIETATCLVSTNINVADPMRDVYDCWRYSTAMQRLTAISAETDLTVEACRDVLDAVHQDGQYATKYSNIFDPIHRRIYIYYNRNYSSVTTMNLDVELALVQPEVTDYYEQDPLFFAYSDDGDICYRKIALTNLSRTSTPTTPPTTPTTPTTPTNPFSYPLHLIQFAACIIVPVAIACGVYLYLGKRRISKGE